MSVMAPAATRARWSSLRLRQSAHLRDLCAETSFTTAHLIQPLFVVEGLTAIEAIPGLDGNYRLSTEEALSTIAADLAAGVRHFLLFAVPSKNEPPAPGAFAARVVEAIKRQFGDALHLWVDICLCSTADDGHCAISDGDHRIDLDATLAALAAMTLRVARAGADGISPSDMMDGRTARLRAALDGEGFGATPIMSYSTKFASKFYGPFRTAAGSAPKHGTREQYQIDVRARTDATPRCSRPGRCSGVPGPPTSSRTAPGAPLRSAYRGD